MKVLMEHYAGSIMYGTNDETSDTDIRGVFVESLNNILLNDRLDVYQDKNQEDYELQELQKFLNMAYDNNPNILETLFCPKEHILNALPIWDIIYKERFNFLSQKAITKFYGYINAQMKRMKKTNNWIRNMYSVDMEIIHELGLSNQIELMDCEESVVEDIIYNQNLDRIKYNMIVHPLHSEYIKVIHNFTGEKCYNKSTYELMDKLASNAIGIKVSTHTYLIYFDTGHQTSFLKNGMISGINKSDLNAMGINLSSINPDLILKFNHDLYDNAMKNYKGYYNWKGTKNSNRLKLQKKNGYDSKFMMHIFRLYLELKDILILKDIRVDRRGIDADFLYDVKMGKYTFDEIVNTIIPDLDAEVNKLILKHKHELPEEPTVDIDDLELRIYKELYNV